MKKVFLLLIFLVSSNIFAQKVVKKEIDEFTKASIIETEWITLTKEFGGYSFFRMKNINDNILLELRFFLKDSYYTIKKDEKLMLMDANKEIYDIFAISDFQSCIGCASTNFIGSKAMGIRPSYQIPNEILNEILENEIIKFRIYTNDGYKDFELSEKKAKQLRVAIRNVLDLNE